MDAENVARVSRLRPDLRVIGGSGCGDGLFSRLLAERGAAVVGCERSARQIAQAQARVSAPGADSMFVVATPQTFTYLLTYDGTFDAAMSVMVLQFATSPESSLLPLLIAPPRGEASARPAGVDPSTNLTAGTEKGR